jgi:hypothetical protein
MPTPTKVSVPNTHGILFCDAQLRILKSVGFTSDRPYTDGRYSLPRLFQPNHSPYLKTLTRGGVCFDNVLLSEKRYQRRYDYAI